MSDDVTVDADATEDLLNGNVDETANGDGDGESTVADGDGSGEGGETPNKDETTDTDGDGNSADGDDEDSDDDKSDDDKSDDDEGAPETYSDFNVPEDMTLDEQVLGKATPLFKELNLSQEQAQKLVDVYSEAVQAAETEMANQHTQQVKAWREESVSDEFIAGADGSKFKTNMIAANKALNEYGDAELKTVLKDSGLSQHPAMVRLFVRLGDFITEDDPANGDAGNGEPESRADAMYSD